MISSGVAADIGNGEQSLCHAGHYVTQDIADEYLSVLEQSTRTKDRALAMKSKKESTAVLSAVEK